MKNQYSRSNRFEKKRKSTKLMTVLMSVASVLIIGFIGLFIFGGNGDDTTAKQPDETQEEAEVKEGDSSDENQSTSDQQSKEESDAENESTPENEPSDDEKDETTANTEETDDGASSEEGLIVEESSSDENVKRSIKKDWKPVETKQDIEGEHRVVYDTESQDWAEMLQAVRQATGLTEANMVTDYIGNGGSPNKAVATVYNRNNNNEIYRVYLKWIEGKGYQAQKMEELKQLPE